jgi:hypothetical protein
VTDREQLVRQELGKQQESARVTLNRGIVLLALVPLVIILAVVGALLIETLGAVMLAVCGGALYCLVAGIGGIAMITSGAVELRRVNRELEALDEPYRLPAARVVVR